MCALNAVAVGYYGIIELTPRGFMWAIVEQIASKHLARYLVKVIILTIGNDDGRPFCE